MRVNLQCTLHYIRHTSPNAARMAGFLQRNIVVDAEAIRTPQSRPPHLKRIDVLLVTKQVTITWN
jgi:hypothetical protein